MKLCSRRAVGAAVMAVLASAPMIRAQEEGSATSFPLQHRGTRTSTISAPTPDEAWVPIGTGIDFQKTFGRFSAELAGTSLRLDTDGDGTTDTTIDGPEGYAVLKGQGTAGRPFRYAVKLRDRGRGWEFLPSTYATGEVLGTPVTLLDLNGNGSFADVGVDGLVVGHSRTASFLSRAICLNGTLLNLSVEPDGCLANVTPYAGPTGTLRLDVETRAKVLTARFASPDRSLCFDLASAPDGSFVVPAGTYVLDGGEIGVAKNRWRFRRGRGKPVDVPTGGETLVSLGGPVRGEFAYQRQGREVALAPDQVWFFGSSGEEYFGLQPLGESPSFTFTSRKTGREIATAYFPGTC